MRSISMRLAEMEKVKINIGYVGENEHTTVLIDCKKAFDEYPEAVASLTVRPPRGGEYPAVVVRNGNIVEWTVTDSDLIYAGNGEIQLTFTVGEVIVKTAIGTTVINRSLMRPGDIPTPIQNWIEQANQKIAAAEEATREAKAAAEHQPIIDDNGNWNTWDDDEGAYVDTGIKAQGEDGAPGRDGQDGQDGKDGKDGKDGEDGQDGAPGQDGTDATPDLITVSYEDLTFPVAAGTQCYHGGKLYEANQAIQTSEQWTAAHWTETTVEGQLNQLKSDLQAIDAAINGTKTAIELTANKGYNAYGKVPGDEFTGGMGDSTGTYCTRIQVLEGEKYKINSNGTGAAFRSYFTRGAGNKIVRISTTAFDGILTINSGEDYLYCTFPNYNSSVNGLWKVSNTLDDKIEEIITEEMKDVSSINFGEKVLVSGVKTGEGYNLGGNDVGDTYSASTTANDKAAYLRIPVEPNTSYIITGKSNQYSFKLFAVIDGFNKIIAIENSSNNYRDTPKVVNPPAGAAYIIVNFWDYDATKDKLEKIHNETLGRLFDTIDEPLKGKTILLLGDSVLGNDRLCGVAECLKEITGATIINGAIGGTRLCGDTRGSGDYVPFDGENLVEAITTGVWTEQDAHASGVVDYVASETLPALKAMDLDDVDIVIFNWMTNDYTNNTTKAKYKTAYKNVVEMLLTENPKLRLLSVTMYWFYTADGGTDVTQSYTMGTGFDAADCTIEAAHENHVPVLDMYRDSPICDLTKAVYLDSDKVHPNNYGNKMYAGMLWGKIKTMM